MDKTIQKNGDELNIMPVLTPISIFVSALLIFIGLLFIAFRLPTGTVTSANTSSGASQAAATTSAKVIPQAQIDALFSRSDVIKLGNSNAKLKIVEISDPSCPYCHVAGGDDPELAKQVGTQFQYDTDGGTYIPPVREIEKLVADGKAQFVWLYFPGHGNGEVATQVLYCAQDQGKFVEAHNALFSNTAYNVINTNVKNDMTKVDQLYALMPSSIDMNTLKTCVSSNKYKDRLASEQALSYTFATGNGFGTPDFFVNYQNFSGAYSWADMKAAANAALN